MLLILKGDPDQPSSVVRTLTAQLAELNRRHRDEVNAVVAGVAADPGPARRRPALKQALEAAHGENLELGRKLGPEATIPSRADI